MIALLAFLWFFPTFMAPVIGLEVANLVMIPEDQKMKQIDIIDLGAEIFMLINYHAGPVLLRLVCGYILFGLLVIGALCVYRWLDTYRMRRRSRLQSPIGMSLEPSS